MPYLNRGRWGIVVLAAVLASAAASTAAHADDFEVVFPAGTACDFALQATGVDDARIMREFTDRSGNVVRTITAGRGADLTLTNLATGSTVSLQGNGSVLSATVNEDGSATIRSTGHNVLVLFPSDVPAGPSTTLYVGRVTYTVDEAGIFTLTGSSGRTRDICAELG